MEETMKRLVIAALGLALISGTAYAGGRGGHGGYGGHGGHGGYGNNHGNDRGSSQGLAVNANVLTGKGGVVGALLGSRGRGKQGLAVNANVVTGKNGVLGLLLGGGRGSSRGHGW
jgi:hypothetical protein